MKTSLWNMATVTVLTVGSLGLVSSRAQAQAFGFSYAGPGVSFGVGTGPYGGAFVGGGYPVVARPPVFVAPPPLVVAPPPVVVARPYVVPPPLYGGYVYGGGFRPYPYRYYRR
jgi:hypothetical protein